MLWVLVLTRDIISTASILQTDIYIVFQYNHTGSIKQGIITIHSAERSVLFSFNCSNAKVGPTSSSWPSISSVWLLKTSDWKLSNGHAQPTWDDCDHHIGQIWETPPILDLWIISNHASDPWCTLFEHHKEVLNVNSVLQASNNRYSLTDNCSMGGNSFQNILGKSKPLYIWGKTTCSSKSSRGKKELEQHNTEELAWHNMICMKVSQSSGGSSSSSSVGIWGNGADSNTASSLPNRRSSNVTFSGGVSTH